MNVLEMVSAINPIAFEIGGLQVRWYGIVCFCNLLSNIGGLKPLVRVPKEFIIDLVFWAVPLGFVGAPCTTLYLNGGTT